MIVLVAPSSPLALLPVLVPLLSVAQAPSWQSVVLTVRSVVRFLSVHTGLPALLVALLLVAVGYRVLKRSIRFLVQLALVTLALVVATELGWLRW